MKFKIFLSILFVILSIAKHQLHKSYRTEEDGLAKATICTDIQARLYESFPIGEIKKTNYDRLGDITLEIYDLENEGFSFEPVECEHLPRFARAFVKIFDVFDPNDKLSWEGLRAIRSIIRKKGPGKRLKRRKQKFNFLAKK